MYSAGTLNAAAPGEVATAFDSTLQKMKIARNTLRLDCALDYYYKESGQPTGMVLKDAAKRKALASQLDTVLSHREAIWFKVETTQSVDSLKRGVPAYTNMYPTSANPGRSIYFSWFGSSLTQVIHINPLFFTKSYAEQEKTVGHELGRYYLGFYTDDSADLWDRLVADLSNPGKIQYLESLQMQLTGQAARAGGG